MTDFDFQAVDAQIVSRPRPRQQPSPVPAVLGCVGAVLLAAGAFCPVVGAGPVTVNLLPLGAGSGAVSAEAVVVLVAAGLTLLCAAFRCLPMLWLTGLAAGAALASAGVRFYLHVQHGREQIAERAAAKRVEAVGSGLERLMLDVVRPEWGCGLLLIGLLAVLAAAAIGAMGREEYRQ